ncbi:phage tail protein [Streptomyces wuyuanensis]|uniref:Phage-related protein n=1 Tax=Streptomyces wuyuanensis TaxID=1196353 RepID=A0A1G9VZJ5_9ACTN|nr:hypothetical protein [Streptomyces wuyuanensis]SDM77573.1 hypothetical protein SAMN05444921_11360 [Streptomyces wuyuanensis]
MALNIGDLFATIRADDSGFRSGLQNAQLRLAGFTRMADGTLRDMHGNVVSRSDAMARTIGARFAAAARTAGSALLTAGKAAGQFGAALGAGVPAAAAMLTALGGLAAGAVSAGIAFGAFKAAVQPQLESVTEASQAAEKADEAHEKVLLKKQLAAKLAAKGGEEYERALKDVESAQRAATEADAAAKVAMEGLPPATQQTAKAFAGLKGDYKAWSDSLSSTTMPVLTKGIGILRDLLPQLTPFVKAAASAFSDMLDKIAVGVKSAGFREWAADMAAAAGPALRNFLTAIGNFGKGFGSLMQAFLPQSAAVTGGLVSMSAAFADWAGSLKGSEGFAQFVALAKEGGATLGLLGSAAVDLLVALAPLIGTTAMIAKALAQVINNTPTPVLTVLATVIASVAIGMKLYAAGAAVVSVANRVMASSAWTAVAGWMRMMAVGLMAYIRIGAAAVASAATTAAAWVGSALVSIGTWIAAVLRASVTAVAQFALMAARAVVWAATMAAQWLIAMGPIGWIIAAVVGLTALIVANWDRIKQWTGQAWDWVWSKIKGVGQMIVNFIANIPLVRFFIQHWDRIKAGVISRTMGLLAYIRSLPGKIVSGLGNLGSLLVDKGKDVIRGLWNGIKSMGRWLKDSLIGFAKSMIPGPIASALGIASPSKLMAKEVGRWIPAGIAMGAEKNAGVLDRTMANLVTPPHLGAMAGGAAVGAGMAGGGGRAGGHQVIVIRGDGSARADFILGELAHAVGKRGGNVQLAVTGRRG